MRKGEIACYKQISPSFTMFSTAIIFGALKLGTMW